MENKNRQRLKQRNLIVLGDSFSDEGGAFRVTDGAWPEPQSHPTHFFTDPSGTWVTHLSRHYANVVHNYAIGGATTDFSVQGGFTGPESLFPVAGAMQQLGFLKAHIEQGKVDLETHLDLFLFIGVNDFYFAEVANEDFGKEWQSAMADNLKNVAEAVRALLDEHFSSYTLVVPSIWNIVETPFGQSYYSNSRKRALSMATVGVNRRLRKSLHEMDPNIVQPRTGKILKRAAQFMEGDQDRFEVVCVKDGVPCQNFSDKTHFFYDTFHPMGWVHQHMANDFAKQLGFVLDFKGFLDRSNRFEGIGSRG